MVGDNNVRRGSNNGPRGIRRRDNQILRLEYRHNRNHVVRIPDHNDHNKEIRLVLVRKRKRNVPPRARISLTAHRVANKTARWICQNPIRSNLKLSRNSQQLTTQMHPGTTENLMTK